jgi:hypothetical protein
MIKKGDLFKHIHNNKILIPHVTNNSGKWGRGFVVSLSAYDKKPELEYRLWHKNGVWRDIKFNLGEVQIIECNSNVKIANMISQNDVKSFSNPIPLKYWALSKTMCHIRDNWNNFNLNEIWCPRFGSGLAGGKPDYIETLINEIWVDAGIPVTVFEL